MHKQVLTKAGEELQEMIYSSSSNRFHRCGPVGVQQYNTEKPDARRYYVYVVPVPLL